MTDNLPEIERLLEQRILDGLKDPNAKASFLEVARKFFSERKAKAQPGPQKTTFSGPLPFPRDDHDDRPAGATSPELREALQVPFRGPKRR